MIRRISVPLRLAVAAGAALLAQGWGKPVSEPRPGPAQCENAPEPLRGLCAELSLPADRVEKDWRAQSWIQRTGSGLSLLIAMVSDPETTGDTLSYDRAVESVQNAAETLQCFMHRYWTPWRSAPSGEKDPQKAAVRTRILDQPGLLAFQAGASSLLVFLVGESPVFGPRRAQFLNALRYVRALAPKSTTVFIAGPNFSGSFPSLKKAIDDATTAYGLTGIRRFRLISPSATVKSAGESFGRADAGRKPECKPAACYDPDEELHDECATPVAASKSTPAICYDSIVHNDTYADEHLAAYLANRWGLGKKEQAVLSESSTGFGASLRPTGEQPRGVQSPREPPAGSALLPRDSQRMPVRFPRGIWRLRQAYPEATARNLFMPGGAQPVQEERLQVSLTGPGSGADMTPDLPSAQMPVTQESMLLEIASSLRQQRIRLAQIAATDIFDAIFIAGFLAKANPNVRLYLADSDALVPRAVERFPLTGALSVTTFPVIGANQLWRSQDPVLNPMSSRFEIGYFNAVRALLLEQRNEPGPLMEYASAPGRPIGRPPLWLTTVGTNGYWPIALLDAGENNGDSLQLKRGGQPDSDLDWPKAAGPGRIWGTVFAILASAAFVLSAALILAQLGGRFGGKLAIWAARPDEAGAYGRAFFGLSECALLGLMLHIVSDPAVRMSFATVKPEWIDWVRIPASAAQAVLAVAALAPWTVIGLHRMWTAIGLRRLRYRTAPQDSRGYLYLSVLPCLALAVFAHFWPHAAAAGNDDHSLQGFFFGYRSLDYFNGVNPVLPLLLLCAGLLALTVLHHRRHTLFSRIEEPPYLGEVPACAGLPAAFGSAREPLGHPVLSAQLLGWLLGAAGIASVGLLPFQGQQSLEGQKYDLLYLGVLLFCCVLVALTWSRALLAGIRLHALLDQLACHPMRQAIAGQPRPVSFKRRIAEWLSASIRSLGAFVRSVPDEHVRGELARRLHEVEELAANCRRPALAGLEKTLTEAATQIAESLLPVWKERLRGGTEWQEGNRTGSAFIAIQYARVLDRMLLQLRGMVLCLAVCLCLAILSTLVYPFRSQKELVWAGTVNFVVLGIPLAIAVIRIEHHVMITALIRRGKRSGVIGTVLRLALYAAAPLIALISPHFPALGRYLVSLLEPALQAFR